MILKGDEIYTSRREQIILKTAKMQVKIRKHGREFGLHQSQID